MFMTLFYSSMIYLFMCSLFSRLLGFLSWSTCLLHFTWHLFYRNEKGKLTQYKGLLYFFYQVYCCLTFNLLNLCISLLVCFSTIPFLYCVWLHNICCQLCCLRTFIFENSHYFKPLNAKNIFTNINKYMFLTQKKGISFKWIFLPILLYSYIQKTILKQDTQTNTKYK